MRAGRLVSRATGRAGSGGSICLRRCGCGRFCSQGPLVTVHPLHPDSLTLFHILNFVICLSPVYLLLAYQKLSLANTSSCMQLTTGCCCLQKDRAPSLGEGLTLNEKCDRCELGRLFIFLIYPRCFCTYICVSPCCFCSQSCLGWGCLGVHSSTYPCPFIITSHCSFLEVLS